MTVSQEGNGWALTAEEWHRRAVHHVELPSGMRIDLHLLSVGELIANGALPDDLREIAVREWDASLNGTPSPTVAAMAAEYAAVPDDAAQEAQEEADGRAVALAEKLAGLNRAICAAALVSPKLDPDQISDLPYADVEMISAILQRRLQFDAAGRRIGVEPLDTFRVFAHEHGCAADCDGCTNTRGALSSVHVGPM